MSRLREAREYLGLSIEEVAAFLGTGPIVVTKIEAERVTPSDRELGRLSKLYRRPVAWLKGEPTAPVEISPELDRLMERLSDYDRSEIVKFAEWLQQKGEA